MNQSKKQLLSEVVINALRHQILTIHVRMCAIKSFLIGENSTIQLSQLKKMPYETKNKSYCDSTLFIHVFRIFNGTTKCYV